MLLTYWVFFSLTIFVLMLKFVMYLKCVVSGSICWLKVLREQGLSRGQIHTVFLALIASRLVRYALPAWSGFLSREQVGQINAFWKECVVFRVN